MKLEEIILSEERKVTVTALIQEVGGEFVTEKRPAIVILPGGAYQTCADVEADPVAFAYAKAGYQTFILRYTLVPNGLWPYPLEDYEQTMELIYENAERWHVATDKIAVIGFSAGGHLAACAATVAKNKPAAALLIYAATTKRICDACQPGMPIPVEEVTEDTVPCFLASCRDDAIDVGNTLEFEIELNKHGIPFESHIYAYGGHGYSTGERLLRVYPATDRMLEWVPDSLGWLDDTLGKLTKDGFTQPNPAVQKNGDTKEMLSVDCTFKHMCKQSEEAKTVLKVLFDFIDGLVAEKKGTREGLADAMGNPKVRDLLLTIKVPEDAINQMNEALAQIVNQR